MKPGTAIALIALFVALGGTGYAAIKLPKNSVTTIQVKDHSLMGRDFKSGQLPAGEDGDAGPPGPQGATGATGPIGPSGVANITIAQGSATLCSGTVDCSVGTAEAICPAGSKPLGGGVISGALNGVFIGAITTHNGYAVGADNYGSSSTATLYAFAYCSTGVQSLKFPDGTMTRPMRVDGMDSLVNRKLAAHRS